jgi:acetyl esterase/lipase
MRPYETVRYGTEPDQFGQLRPAAGTAPVVVLLHGGYWRQRYGLDLMEPLAADLNARGYAVWNLEYRRTGWPDLFDDVAAGLDALAGLADRGLDLTRVALVGHSAGGHLALWVCTARTRIRPAFVVSLAGVCDLVEAARQRLSRGAVLELLGGGPDEVPDRYREACPTLLLPLGVRQLVVHGTEDGGVPFEFGPRYVAAARAAGDDCELLALPGVEHFALIDPASAAWAEVATRLDVPRGVAGRQAIV